MAVVLIGALVERLRVVCRQMRHQLVRREHPKRAQETEDYLRLVDQMPVVLWATDATLNITSSIGEGPRKLGLQPSRVVGMSLFEYFQTDDLEFPPIAAHRRALRGDSSNCDMVWDGHHYQVHVEPSFDPAGHIIGTIGARLDVTERKETEHALRHREALLEGQLRESEALAEANAALREAETLEELASRVARQAARLVEADVALLYMANESRNPVAILGTASLFPEALGYGQAIHESIAGQVIQTGSAYRAADSPPDPQTFNGDSRTGRGPVICIPLRNDAGKVVGALLVARRHSLDNSAAADWSPQAERIVRALAETAQNVLQGVRTHEELEEAYVQAVLALANVTDARDTYTADHSEHVAALAVASGRDLRCSDHEVQSIEWAALLHDIGKVAVPDRILRKPGALTEEEWAVVKRHPEVGAQIISPVRRLHPVMRIVRHHHERWDGTGYPDGLRKEAIPLGARILAVADAYIAMTDGRVYRRALSHEEAAAELRRHAGTQFDPQIIGAFCRMIAAHPVRRLSPDPEASTTLRTLPGWLPSRSLRRVGVTGHTT